MSAKGEAMRSILWWVGGSALLAAGLGLPFWQFMAAIGGLILILEAEKP